MIKEKAAVAPDVRLASTGRRNTGAPVLWLGGPFDAQTNGIETTTFVGRAHRPGGKPNRLDVCCAMRSPVSHASRPL